MRLRRRASKSPRTIGATYVFVFKPGRLPALWEDFQGLLPLCPEQRVGVQTPAGARQVYRWVHELSYTDSGRAAVEVNGHPV